MTNDHFTNNLSANELATVQGGLAMSNPIEDLAGVGAWGAAGPGGYVIFQGGLGVGHAIKDWWGGRGRK